MTETDLELYRKYNDDLASLDELALKRHYESFGRAEDRIRTKADIARVLANFDVNAYRRLNADIANLSNEELTEHWLKYGWREGRKCSQDPDYRLSSEEQCYVKRVDYRRVAKDIQEVLERISNYGSKLKDRTEAGMVKFLDEVITKTDAKLNLESRRYIFIRAWEFLVDMMYAAGEFNEEQYIRWLEIARSRPKIIDK